MTKAILNSQVIHRTPITVTPTNTACHGAEYSFTITLDNGDVVVLRGTVYGTLENRERKALGAALKRFGKIESQGYQYGM